MEKIENLIKKVSCLGNQNESMDDIKPTLRRRVMLLILKENNLSVPRIAKPDGSIEYCPHLDSSHSGFCCNPAKRGYCYHLKGI